MYVSNETPITYNASFHIQLDSIGKNKTLEQINTLRPEIYVLLRTIIHHAPGFNNKYEVQPTTIEEYKILLAIADKLKIRDKMPLIILPQRIENHNTGQR